MITMRTPRKHMPSTSAKRPPAALTIEEFRRDRLRAVALASKPGGLRVEDTTGKLIFHMVVPNTIISDISR
jgi:excinuclease UvrABC helicase subunit UvrB